MEKPQQNQTQYPLPTTATPNNTSWTPGYKYDTGSEYDQYTRDQEQVPEDPKERWRRHFRYTLSIREEKNVAGRFWRNLKVFLLDCWLDIVTVLITIAVAAAVCSFPLFSYPLA